MATSKSKPSTKSAKKKKVKSKVANGHARPVVRARTPRGLTARGRSR